MPKRSEQILADALTLPASERAELAERILASLDLSAQHENDTLWAREVEERIDAYERGEIKSVPAKDVFQRIDSQKS